MSAAAEQVSPRPYQVPDKLFRSAAMSFYAVLYVELRLTARAKGYALALHGSLRRDMDLVAVPWTEDAAPEVELIKALTETAEGICDLNAASVKPHGRKAWTITFPGASAVVPPEARATYLDVSVMPRVAAQP